MLADVVKTRVERRKCFPTALSLDVISVLRDHRAMPTTASLLAFALLALGMVLTPGPNMLYLLSRSVCQGPRAGLISLAGVGVAFLVYLLAAVLGVTALLMAMPYTYDGLRLLGAGYLAYLAWQALRPGGRSALQVRQLPKDSPRRLFAMGFTTNLLNPKAALLYVSLLPQFIDPAGSVLTQLLVLGAVQITISMSVNACIVLLAGGIAGRLNARPGWLVTQRLLMGTVLGGLALAMVLDTRR